MKKEELRGFDVFLCVFWKKGEKLRIRPGREQDPGKTFFFFGGMEVPGAFYSPDMDYEVTTL